MVVREGCSEGCGPKTKTCAQKPPARMPKKIRPPTNGTAWFDIVLRGRGLTHTYTYKDGGVAFAVGVGVVLGACAGVVVPAPVLVIRRISTRRFLARPSRVLLVSTGLSLPSPIR